MYRAIEHTSLVSKTLFSVTSYGPPPVLHVSIKATHLCKHELMIMSTTLTSSCARTQVKSKSPDSAEEGAG